MLSAGNHFPRIRHHAFAIPAVNTVEFFNAVEIGQLVTIHDHVVAAFHPANAIQPETDVLMEHGGDIEKRDRHDHGVNERG